MNIALLSEKYPPAMGGLAVSVQRLARLLVGAGHTVQVFTLTSDLSPGETAQLDSEGVQILNLGPQRRMTDTLISWSDIIIRYSSQKARSGQPFDLLHGYFLTLAGFTAVYAAQMLGLPGVVSARGNDLDRAAFDPGKAAHIFYTLQHATTITANSSELAQKVKAFCGRSAALIPNGVDGKLFHPQPHNPEPAARLGISGRVLGFAGEARAKKGLNALLLAFRGLAVNQPLSLLLVGGARQGEDLGILTVFQKQNPDLKVILTDFVPLSEMPAYYNLMDVVLIPSLHDGLPNALLEAMACARPVVAARSGGIPDALTDHENGLLVEPGDEHALAQAVQSLLDDPLLCQRLGHAARVTVLDRFTPMQELKKTVEVYAEALSRNNRR